jgi:hypothetical protein
MKKYIPLILIMLTSCANNEWRHGNYHKDISVGKKREKQRDKYMSRATDYRVGTAKHYINEHKKRDGKLNIFYRDGFDFDL